MGDALAAAAIDSGSIPIDLGAYSKIGDDGFPQIELCAMPTKRAGAKRR